MSLPQKIDVSHMVDRYPPCGVGLLRGWRVETERGVVTVLEYADRLAIYGAVDWRWSELDRVRRLVWNDRRAETIDLAPTRHLWATPEVDALVADLSTRLHATLGAGRAAASLARAAEAS